MGGTGAPETTPLPSELGGTDLREFTEQLQPPSVPAALGDTREGTNTVPTPEGLASVR